MVGQEDHPEEAPEDQDPLLEVEVAAV